MRPKTRTTDRRIVVALIFLALILAACSDSAGDFEPATQDAAEMELFGTSSDGAPDEAAEPVPPGDFEMPDSDEPQETQPIPAAEPGAAEVLAVLPTAAAGRDIIFTADMTVAVNDVSAAGEEALRLMQGLGGFLFGQRTVGAPETSSTLIFKVAPEDFEEALRRLGTLGEVRSQHVSADDVTERIVDLQSRIETAVTSVERLRDLLSAATDIDTIIELENQLLARETQLETLRGQLRTLQDQVALATISLTLTEAASRPALELEATAYPGHDGGLSCPGGRGLSVEQRTEATVCFEIVNTGDTWLTDFELRDPVLGVEMGDLIAVFGDPSAAIEPGESILLAAEIEPERTVRTRTTVTAQAVDSEGESIPGRPVAQTVTMFIEAVAPVGIPGFTEGLAASWEVLVRLSQVVVLIAGGLIPFIWVPALLLFWWYRRTRAAKLAADVAPVASGAEEG